MGSGGGSTVRLLDDLCAGLSQERADALRHAHALVASALPSGYEEVAAGKMIAWVIPLQRYPSTYNRQPLQLAALAAQKNHNALYLMGLYMSPERTTRFEDAYRAAGKRLDMGKSCLRFRRREDLADEAIRDAIARTPVDALIADYEAARSGASSSA